MKRLAVFSFAAVLAASLAYGQRTQRKPVDLSRAAKQGGQGVVSLSVKPRAAAAGRLSSLDANADASTVVQAPGVVQLNTWEAWESGRECYFVATNTIPADTVFEVSIASPGGRLLTLQQVKIPWDTYPGESFTLPDLKRTGYFWEWGLTQIQMRIVTPDGTESWSVVDFGTADANENYFRNYADAQKMVPGITGTREYLDTDGSVMVEIKGRFQTTSKPKVVFENLTIPSASVQLVDGSTVVVNLSNAVGYYYDPSDKTADLNGMVAQYFDATKMKGYLLTVGQGGWADTMPFRHTPFN